MKLISILTFLIFFSFGTYAQTDSLPGLEPYFSAIIVKDIDTSIDWYNDVLGFSVLNRIAAEAFGFKQANLKRGNILIELIELDKAVSPEKVIPGYNSKTRLLGFFKTGFRVSDFDAWVKHLRAKEVNFHGDVVEDPNFKKQMVIILDPDGNRIQIFEK